MCEDQHIILVGPKSESDAGWLASEAEFVQEAARDVMKEYTIDRRRVVAHGMGVGGQMAFYLGFNARDLVRGVATTGAVLGTAPKPTEAGQRLAFFVVAGGKDPLVKDIAGVEGPTRRAEIRGDLPRSRRDGQGIPGPQDVRRIGRGGSIRWTSSNESWSATSRSSSGLRLSRLLSN